MQEIWSLVFWCKWKMMCTKCMIWMSVFPCREVHFNFKMYPLILTRVLCVKKKPLLRSSWCLYWAFILTNMYVSMLRRSSLIFLRKVHSSPVSSVYGCSLYYDLEFTFFFFWWSSLFSFSEVQFGLLFRAKKGKGVHVPVKNERGKCHWYTCLF
jgi:hypothetical protein